MILCNHIEFHLQIDYLVLTNQLNKIECRVLNSPPTTLLLWHHRELIIETNSTQLEYVVTPYQFGQYTCQTNATSTTSLVIREKGKNIKVKTIIIIK